MYFYRTFINLFSHVKKIFNYVRKSDKICSGSVHQEQQPRKSWTINGQEGRVITLMLKIQLVQKEWQLKVPRYGSIFSSWLKIFLRLDYFWCERCLDDFSWDSWSSWNNSLQCNSCPRIDKLEWSICE